MGYELRIYAGEVTSVIDKDGRAWFDVIGMIDLSKPGYESHIYNDVIMLKKIEGVPVYWYHRDDLIEKTLYGDYLVAIQSEIVIKALKKDVQESDYYRFKIALDFIESMVRNYEDTQVVLFGY